MKDLVIPGSILLFARRTFWAFGALLWLLIAIAAATGAPQPGWVLPVAASVVAARFAEKALE